MAEPFDEPGEIWHFYPKKEIDVPEVDYTPPQEVGRLYGPNGEEWVYYEEPPFQFGFCK